MALTPRIRFQVLQRDGFTCRYCGQRPPAVKLEADHIVPRSKGGSDDLENLIASCVACNRGKAARPIDGVEWEHREEENPVRALSLSLYEVTRLVVPHLLQSAEDMGVSEERWERVHFVILEALHMMLEHGDYPADHPQYDDVQAFRGVGNA